MPELGPPGSVRGVLSDGHFYRDNGEIVKMLFRSAD